MTPHASYRLQMNYAGADWVQRNLDAYHQNVGSGRTRPSKKKVAKAMSPLGIAVADALGYVWCGIYHLPWEALQRVRWDDDWCIEVRVQQGLSTWDFSDLTQLVVVCHDMLLRLCIDTSGPRHLSLMFHQRGSREGGTAVRMPTLEENSALIRRGYEVKRQSDVSQDHCDPSQTQTITSIISKQT